MLPLEMTHYPSWVVWRYEERNGKPTKVPYNPRTLYPASVTEPSHWATYAEANSLFKSRHGNFDGVGFVFSKNDPYTGIDLDDPAGDQRLIERAQAVLEAFNNTYVEVSHSGKGLHIIVRGHVMSGRRREKIEMYSTDRYFAMTGNTFRDLPIEENDYFLNQLWSELGGGNVPVKSLEAIGSPQKMSDEDVYLKARDTNEKFLPLFQGKYQQWYGSQSEADIALVNILSFYSRNPDQIARLFYISELGKRSKAHRKDYLNNMITKSFDNLAPDISLDVLMANLTIQMNADKEKERKKPTSMLGDGWQLPNGLVGEIAQFIYDAAPRPVQEIALAGALGLMAGICGRSYNVSNTGLNHYILVLATTGRGKEAAKAGITKLMRKVASQCPGAHDFIGPSDIASGQALVKYLGQNPCFVSILGEFGLSMQQMCAQNASSSQVTLRKVILDLFNKSGRNDTMQQTIYSDKANNTAIVVSPAFTILGESTPDSFFPHMSEDIIAQGLLPRFTCIEYSGERKKLNEHHSKAQPPDGLVETLITLCANSMTLQDRHEVIDVKCDDEASAFIHDFDVKCDERINNAESEVARQLWTRGHMKLLKLAALIAVGEDMHFPIIRYATALWACNMVEKDIANILERWESGRIGKDSAEQNQIKYVNDVIKDYLNRPFDATLSKYMVDENMHRDRVIQWHYLSKRVLAQPSFKQDKMGASFALRRCIDTIVANGGLLELNAKSINDRYKSTAKAFYVSDLSKLG